MNLRANATFKAGDFARLEAKLVPLLTQGAQDAANAVLEISQGLVPVDTGELKASGGTAVEWVGQAVNGYVVYTSEHAAYVELGTGRRGAASPGAGPVDYDPNWPGMVAQAYIRPALDIGRQQTVDAFRAALGA